MMLHLLVTAGQLPPLTNVVEWKVPGEESVSRPPKGYIVSFVAFQEHGFSTPAGRFIRRVRASASAPQSQQRLTDGGVRGAV
jgi:hypothetical protein